ncbi:MAG TPA: hypothetical protein EYP14_17280 [Planctomycetaceae bacterium]|nr:hypothetical protein [Planctomycetaceae bacterium]
MLHKHRRTRLFPMLLATASFWYPRNVFCGLILDFREGQAGNVAAQFDGDGAGDPAGPFFDSATGISATLTTRSVAPSGSLNTTASGLGLNAVGTEDQSAEFDVGESWTFDWNVDVYFEGIDLIGVNTTGEYFTIQSDAWINRAGVNPASSDVSFSASTGTFTLTGGELGDDFDLIDLTGGTLLPVPAGTDIVISFGDSAAPGSGIIERMQWATVPEPPWIGLILFAVVAGGIGRRFSKRGRGCDGEPERTCVEDVVPA